MPEAEIQITSAFKEKDGYKIEGYAEGITEKYQLCIQSGNHKKMIETNEFKEWINVEENEIFILNGRMPISFFAISETEKIPLAICITNESLKKRFELAEFVLDEDYILSIYHSVLEIERLTGETFQEREKKQWQSWREQVTEGKIRKMQNPQDIREYRKLAIYHRKEEMQKNICLMAISKKPDKSLVEKYKNEGFLVRFVTDSKKTMAGLLFSYPGRAVSYASRAHIENVLFAKRLVCNEDNQELLNPFGEDDVYYCGVIQGAIDKN